jgi:hypothetical protein
VWVLGLPLVVVHSVPFASDATYFMFGGVIALFGLAVLPLVLALRPPLVFVGLVVPPDLVDCARRQATDGA